VTPFARMDALIHVSFYATPLPFELAVEAGTDRDAFVARVWDACAYAPQVLTLALHCFDVRVLVKGWLALVAPVVDLAPHCRALYELVAAFARGEVSAAQVDASVPRLLNHATEPSQLAERAICYLAVATDEIDYLKPSLDDLIVLFEAQNLGAEDVEDTYEVASAHYAHALRAALPVPTWAQVSRRG